MIILKIIGSLLIISVVIGIIISIVQDMIETNQIVRAYKNDGVSYTVTDKDGKIAHCWIAYSELKNHKELSRRFKLKKITSKIKKNGKN